MRFDRSFPALIIAGALAAGACSSEAETEAAVEAAAVMLEPAPDCWLRAPVEEAEARPSPLRQVEFTPGGHSARLCYGAPSANGRVVVGGELVPFGAPWRAGANEATALHLTGPATIGGIAVEPGAYSLYVVAGEAEWQIHINANFERWGIPIGDEVQAADVGSFTVVPIAIEDMVETLQYRWEGLNDGSMGDLVVEWERTQVRIHIM